MRSRAARRVEAAALSTYRRLPPPVRRALVRLVKPRFTVGAVLVVTRTPGPGRSVEVLLVRQRHTHGWGLPGGLLNRGESPAEALVRELDEELRLQVDPAALPEPTLNVDPGPRRVDVVFCWQGALPGEPRRRGPEILEVRWHRLDRLPRLTGPTAQVLRAR